MNIKKNVEHTLNRRGINKERTPKIRSDSVTVGDGGNISRNKDRKFSMMK